MMQILRQIHLIKTVYFNFKIFSFRQAIRFPVFIGHHTKFVSLKGKIHIENRLHPGMIRFGFGNVGIVDKQYSRTLIELDGKIEFEGVANFGTGSKLSVGKSGFLKIGERFNISAKSTLICFNSIILGNDVLLSWDILIMDTDFHNTRDTITNEIYPISSPISVGDNVWVGTRSVILKGTSVPSNTIIGANSLLNKKYLIDENSVLAGIPARIVKNNIRRIL